MKTKRIAKFGGLEPRRCEDIKEIVAPEINPKSFGTFQKQAPSPIVQKLNSATCCVPDASLFQAVKVH